MFFLLEWRFVPYSLAGPQELCETSAMNRVVTCLVMALSFVAHQVKGARRSTAHDNSTRPFAGGMLWVVRTFPGRYASHAALQAKTWMRHLRPGRDVVLLATQRSGAAAAAKARARAREKTGLAAALVSAPVCDEDNHGVGLCCQELAALRLAASWDEFEWVFVIDDDVYARPSVVWDVARSFRDRAGNATGPPGAIAVGTVGCAAHGISGFCGGGGYLLSRGAVRHFSSERGYMDNCRLTGYCDITTAWLLREQGRVPVATDARFHPWGITPKTAAARAARTVSPDVLDGLHGQLAKIRGTTGTEATLEELCGVVEWIAERKVATLHYYGGTWIDDQIRRGGAAKMRFLDNLFDAALGGGERRRWRRTREAGPHATYPN